MPLTEGPAIDRRTEDFRWLVDYVRGDDSAYRVAIAKQEAEAEAKAERSRFMSMIAKRKRPGHKGSRPWQRDGFTSRQAWLDHFDAQPPLPDPDQPTEEV